MQSLEKKLKIPQEYEKVVYSYYIDSDQQCVAQITLFSRKYDETNFLEELQKELLPSRPHRIGEENQKEEETDGTEENRPNQPAEQTVP